MTESRVAITGLGLMTSLGLDLETTWTNLLAGTNTVGPFRLFDHDGVRSPFGFELPEGAADIFSKFIKPRQRKQMTRATMIACTTAEMAVLDAGLKNAELESTRVGVVAGATGTGYAPPTTETDRHRILRNMASAPAAWISLKGKWRGPSFTVSTACSSGAYALHSAYSLIQTGECDIVIAGAADSAINFLDIEGFCSLFALSEDTENMLTASRPFDKERSGFVMGEGGGMMVVESLSHARKRGATIRALLSKPGLCSEAYNIISPEPEGKSISRAMDLALKHAGLAPDDIDYINAHGTSTPHNDLYETQAIKRVFEKAAWNVPISSTKSMTGHCLSAAAGVEAVICCKAIEEGHIPPTINLNTPDPELDLDYVPNTFRAKTLNHVMSNSFAFGGQNGVIVLSKHEP